jgi:SAM-dependent methyltransferase
MQESNAIGDHEMAALKCRTCNGQNLEKVLSLGRQPLANSFLKADQLSMPEDKYPLDVVFCNDCYLVQLADVVSPEILFKNYLYIPSVSDTLRLHFAGLARQCVESFRLSESSLVIDIGSNDGTLLGAFKEYGLPILGVEPASNIATLARSRGIDTINEFFSKNLALKIRQEKGTAKIICATNVFAHVNDLDDFMQSVKILLDKDGVFVIEVPYLVDLIEKTEFDTIYHEHLSYFSIHPLVEFLRQFDMEIYDVSRISIHGGSIRLLIRHRRQDSSNSPAVERLVRLERKRGLFSFETYLEFANSVQLIRNELTDLLSSLRHQGKRIAGYGAPAKGTVLLNYCDICKDVIEYVVDKSPYKQGLYVPGVRIPVYPVEKLVENAPDYTLLLAWNFADEIFEQQMQYQQRGGRFIVPIPKPQIVQCAR